MCPPLMCPSDMLFMMRAVNILSFRNLQAFLGCFPVSAIHFFFYIRNAAFFIPLFCYTTTTRLPSFTMHQKNIQQAIEPYVHALDLFSWNRRF